MPFTATVLRKVAPGLALLVGVLLLAVEALAAQTYSVNAGFWTRNSGRFTNVPFVGNTVNNCPGATLMTATQTITGATPSMVPNTIAAAQYGCPTAASGQTLVATAAGMGAAFTLPTHLISRPPYGALVTVNLPYATNLIQAATDGRWRIPHAARAYGMTSTATDALGMSAVGGPGSVGPTKRQPPGCIEATCTNLATFRRFEQNAYANQTGRAGANFTWCFGAGSCATIGQATTYNPMLVRYTAQGPAFGGTSNALVNTTIIGTIYAKIGGTAVAASKLDSGVGQIQVQGRGYADFLTEMLANATMGYGAYMVMSGTVMAQGSMGATTITIPSKITALTGPFPLPPANNVNQNYGFPLTTGTVLVRRIDNNPVVVTITGMGYDSTTGGGARNISLVSGALSNLSQSQNNTATFSRLTLQLMPEPGRVLSLAAGVLALLGMAAWRVRKAR